MNSAADPVIALRDVRCEAAGRTLLHIDTFDVRAGERIALIGSNGAGKSTLLRVLSGFHRAAGGSVTVLGHRLDRPLPSRELRRLRCDVAQVLQDLHLVARLTVLDNVAIGALGRIEHAGDIARSWLRWWSPGVLQAAHAALATAGLSAMADVPLRQLSGGERQKVAIARMLMQRPRLVLADEPTANLDPQTALQFGTLLQRCAADVTGSLTTISVVHNPDLIASLATRVIGLRGGRMTFDKTATAVDREDLDRLYR